jgi:hypothetical protein
MLYLFIVANSNNTMHIRVVENGGQYQHVSGSTSWSPKVVTAATSGDLDTKPQGDGDMVQSERAGGTRAA